MKPLEVREQAPEQLGSVVYPDGVSFAVYSENARSIDLCLFDEHNTPTQVIELPGCVDGVWHGFVPNLAAGQRYAYVAHGEHDPQRGLFFDGTTQLLDPYARVLTGSHSASQRPICVVDGSESSDTRARPTPSSRLIYEAYVRGLTMTRSGIADEHRGKFDGVAEPALLAHLKSLGVTTIELQPVQAFVNEPHLNKLGLNNYWGYNPVAFFVPHLGYASNPLNAKAEFLRMVRALHDANIEVVIDVVFNHTAESGADGPVWSFRGLDNPTYYVMQGSEFANYTGCGNTLNVAHPAVQRMIVDCLRYWANDMEVDGFRFDLAVTLGRNEQGGFEHDHPLYQQMVADPVVSKRLLIAEPWDVGPDGYRLGGFPSPWYEWNDRYRDDVRAYWRGDAGAQGPLGKRLHGSSEYFEASDRGPAASINFIAAHDGFVLQDVVSYANKHNDANGENNADGHNHNLSDNCGVEGPSDDPYIAAIRSRRKRALAATLLLSQGTPMWLAGDEVGNSQDGNNNAYCQDNPLGWIDWEQGENLTDLLSRLGEVRSSCAAYRLERFVHTDAVRWLRFDGAEMSEEAWHAEDCPFAMLWCVQGEQLLVCFNRSNEAVRFMLPEGGAWRCLVDTDHTSGRPQAGEFELEFNVAHHSVVAFKQMELKG